MRFLSVAEQELEEARAWYARQFPGLEHEFMREVDQPLRSIAAFPDAWHPLSRAPGGDDCDAFRTQLFIRFVMMAY